MTARTMPRRRPTPAAPPPCDGQAERWLDRSDRTHALKTCLHCPIRRWCAQEALRVRASWGMWAGVWIDGQLSDVAAHLSAIAADAPASAPSPPNPPASSTDSADGPTRPLPRSTWTPPARSARPPALVLARSSGHCEVFGERCQLGADRQLSRVPGVPAARSSTPAAVYAACPTCAATVADPAHRDDARRLGYLVESLGHAASAPFLWRGSRWVHFGSAGELRDLDTAAHCSRAS